MTVSLRKPICGCGLVKSRRVLRSGPEWRCRPCANRKARERRAANPQRYRDYARRGQLAFKYGLTPEDVDRAIRGQGGVCAICGSAPPEGNRKEESQLHVDHDHSTGAIRGMLCGPCNRALGWLERFRIPATEYLDRFADLYARGELPVAPNPPRSSRWGGERSVRWSRFEALPAGDS